MPSGEVVLTTRRARWCAPDGSWVAGRLRITDRRVVLTGPDGVPAFTVDLLDVGAVRLVRLPRTSLALATPRGVARLRCFEVSAVARLVEEAVNRARAAA